MNGTPFPAAKANVLFAALFAGAAALLCVQVDEPFIGRHEGWNAAVYGTAARAHLEYGPGTTRLGMIVNGDTVPPAGFILYTNHPPLLPLALAASFAAFGKHEWAARLVPILFTLASLVLLWRIGTRLRGQAYGLLAAAIFALMPMNAFYGRMVNHEAPVLAFVLAALYAYLRWRDGEGTRWFALSLVALALAMATGWPGYYMAGLLAVFHPAGEPGVRRDRRVLLYPALALAAFGLFVLHVAWLRGSAGLDELASQFVTRTSAHTVDFAETGAEPFSWSGFVRLWAVRSWKLFTLPVLAASLFELWDAARERGGPARRARAVALLLLAFALTHLLLFRQGAWVHEFWGAYLSAPLALLAAGGIIGLGGGRAAPRITAFFLLLLAAAAAPRIRALYAADDVRILEFSRLAAAHARPGELVATNEGFVKPQVAWYARRDPIETPLWSAPALADTLRDRGRPVAFFLLEGEPESGALEAWLAPRYPSVTDSVAGRRYRIYHVPGGAADVTAGHDEEEP